MIEINLPKKEWFDSSTNRFLYYDAIVLHLEHNLAAIARWEERWKKPFLSSGHTAQEMDDYICCMSDLEIDEATAARITNADKAKIFAYINENRTATTFGKGQKGRRKKITNEVLYALMAQYGIPFECDKWHLSRLMTLLQVCQSRDAGPQKMGRAEAMAQQIALNAERRKRSGGRG